MIPSSVSTPDVVDLRLEGARAMESFGDEPEQPQPEGQVPDQSVSSTLTYEPFYGLREKPFSLSTDPRFLYRSGSHTPVLLDLAAAIRRREGLVVLTGDIGLGKTTLCRAVVSQLDRKTFTTFVPDPFVTREDLLKNMLIEFGVMSVEDLVKGRLKGASRPDLSYPLYEFLQSLEPLDAFAVLVIDEVQNLSLPLLEEIRILSDLEIGGRKLLQVVLVGQPEFDEQLRLPRMRQIKQRVSVHRELGPLGRDGVAGYVAHRLQTAGASPGRVALTEEALDLVHAASGGVPRVINLLCDRALMHGHVTGASRIGPELVRAGMIDLRMAVPIPTRVETVPPPPLPLPQQVEPPAPEPVVLPVPAPVPATESKGLFEAKPSAAAAATAGDLTSLLDLPAVDLKVAFEGGPVRRPTRNTARPFVSMTRGKVWSTARGLRPAAAAALTVLGLTTGVSLVGYWLWLRPLWVGPVSLPTVSRPSMVLTTLGPLVLGPPQPGRAPVAAARPVEPQAAAPAAVPPPAAVVPAAQRGSWVIQTGVFSTSQRAAAVVARLTAIGYPAFEREQTFITRGTFRVTFAGPYKTRADAEAALPALRRVPDFADAHVRPLTP